MERPSARERTDEVTRPISLPSASHGGARPGHRLPLEAQPGERAVDVAAILHPCHQLLTDIATLGIADEVLAAQLRQQHRVVHVYSKHGLAAFHAQHLGRLVADRPRARLEQRPA